MKLWQIAMVSVAAGIALPAIAQMGGAPATRAEVEARVKDRLGQYDTNKDGTVSRDELRTYAEKRMAARADAQFAAMDANKDGSVSRAEFDAWQKSRADRFAMIGRRMAPPVPPTPPAPGAAPTPPSAEGKPVIRREMRIVTRDGSGPRVMAWSSDGNGIVIADAVKRALDRFDAMDANKDGTVTPEERRAAREARRAKG